MIEILLFFLFITPLTCFPCNEDGAWQCPNSTTCIRKSDLHGANEVCGVPPLNIPRCPNGGDIGKEACTDELCQSIGLIKCPFDPFCVRKGDHACRYCPHGAMNEDDCGIYSTGNAYYYERCDKTTQKYYNKYYDACNNVSDCPDGRDEKGCVDHHSCSLKTIGGRPFKCPLDNVCIEKDDDENKCKCPSEYNVTICDDTFCKSLQLSYYDEGGDKREYGDEAKYVKCPKDPKCIGFWKFCDGQLDCPSGGDEEDCSKEGCAKMGKFKCKNESRCIERKFVCDGDIDEFDSYYDYYHKYKRNKCEYSFDESNDGCIELCHQQNKFVCPKKLKQLVEIKEHCMPQNQTCNIVDNATKILETLPQLPKNYLWRCSKDRLEYIHPLRVCDGIFNCALHEDESDSICGHFPFTRALSWSSTMVMGLVTLMFCLRAFEVFNHSLTCKNCIINYTISDEDWVKKQRLFTTLFDKRCKEFVESSSFTHSTSNELKEAYKAVHDHHTSKKGIKDVFAYVSWRVDVKFTFKNMFNVMEWRHAIYKRLYEAELTLHHGNQVDVLKCLRKNLGTGQEAFHVLDFKEEPTKLTQASIILSTIMKTIFHKKLTIPLLKLFAFVFDVTKDIAFASYMGNLLFGEQSDELSSSDDYFVFSTYIVSLLFGQLLLSIFSLKNRYTAFSVCPHQTSLLTSSILYGLLIVLFPVTGVIMSTDKYFNEKNVEKDFERIVKGLPIHEEINAMDQCFNTKEFRERIKSTFQKPTHRINWSEGIMSKYEFEDIMTKIGFTENQQKLGGFEKIKMVENVIESFLQIVVVLLMFYQKPHEGLFNQSVFGLSLKEEEEILGIKIKNGAQLLFIGSSAMGYLFMATGVVAFITVVQKNSMGVKEKIVLVTIHLIRIGSSLVTCCVLLLLKSNVHSSLGFLIWLSIILIKLTLLLVICIANQDKKDSIYEMILFLACNFNLPVHLKKFEEAADNGLPKLNKKFVLVWCLSGIESFGRLLCIGLFTSTEFFHKMVPSLSFPMLTSIVVLMESVIFGLWHLFFKKLYIWRQLMKDNGNQVSTNVMPEQTNDIEEVEDQYIALNTEPTTKTEAQKEQPFDNSINDTRIIKRSKSLEYVLSPIKQRKNVEETSNLMRRHSLGNVVSLSLIGEKNETSDEKPILERILDTISNYINCQIFKCDLNFCSVDNLRKCPKSSISKQKCGSYFLSLSSISLIIICILSLNGVFDQHQTYNDCWEVNIRDKQKDGVYQLNINDQTVYTYCKAGMALIQRRDPEAGNNVLYFNRELKEFTNGFGFLEKEMFLGLQHMFALNQMNNTVLRLELIKQKDESQIWIEFDHFVILRNAFDNITYNMNGVDHKRNQNESFPIVSLGNQTSSERNGQFVFIRPSYIKSLKEKTKERKRYKWYHDNFYLAFTTLDQEINYDCSRKFQSGWWFPYSMYNGCAPKCNAPLKEYCSYDPGNETNLNGVYAQDITKNQRQIAFCTMNKIERTSRDKRSINSSSSSQYEYNYRLNSTKYDKNESGNSNNVFDGDDYKNDYNSYTEYYNNDNTTSSNVYDEYDEYYDYNENYNENHESNENIDGCISPTYEYSDYGQKGIADWEYKNMKIIKLKQTEMWLGRR